MFRSFADEVAKVKTPRFHLVEGPAAPELRVAITESSPVVDPEYKEFCLQFGNCKLYRKSREGYRIGVFAAPRARNVLVKPVLQIGFYEGSIVYCIPSEGASGYQVWEFDDGNEEATGQGFSEWLKARCRLSRNMYSKLEWDRILQGPEPFTPKELKIVKTRQQIKWKVLGIESNGFHRIELNNMSEDELPVLTLGVRSKGGGLNGAVRLDVTNLRPGDTRVVTIDCYSKLVPPDEIELFGLPDPLPEDREYYAELTNTGS